MPEERKARRQGQVVPRDAKGKKWLVSVYLHRDANGRKVYRSEVVHGGRKEAEKRLRALLREKDQGRLVVPSKVPLREFVEDWLTKTVKPRTRPSTAASYRSVLEDYVLPDLGATPLDRLKPIQLQAVVAKLTERGLAPRTIRYALSLLKSALRTAVRWRQLGWNPMDEVDLPAPHRTELQVPQADARRALLRQLEADEWWPLWALMVTTGVRPGEALGLRWSDVDLDAPLLTVQHSLSRVAGAWSLTEPKTRAGVRAIPLDEWTAGILRRHRARQLEERMRLGVYYQDRGFVFAGPQGEPLDWHNVGFSHFKRAASRAAMTCAVCGEQLEPMGADKHPEHHGGRRFDHEAAPHPELADLPPYSLRHLCASLLLAAGTDLKTVSQRLGHTDAGFTLRTSTHVVPGTQAAATAAIAEEVFGKGGQNR